MSVTDSPPPSPLPDPSRPLPSAALAMFVLRAAAGAAGALVFALGAGAILRAADEGTAEDLGRWLPLAVAVLGVAYVALVPRLTHRRWRWDLRDTELDLRRGAFRVVRTVVPLSRIQHVDVERTVFTQLFGLVQLRVHTAAGATTIPALREPDAAAARQAILERLREPDEL